jgi:hypothetical protein
MESITEFYDEQKLDFASGGSTDWKKATRAEETLFAGFEFVLSAVIANAFG